MKKNRKNAIKMLCSAVFMSVLLSCNTPSAFAEVTLPEGTVAGLPERLTVMDDGGNSVSSETGEYFFAVEDMILGETYSKTIQIMNLREDKAYHIYFYAQPLDREGEIDLEEECMVRLSLNGESVYEGKVTGEGNPDMRETPIDLGLYEPGQTAVLDAQVTWGGTDAGGFIDYGSRLTDANGTTVIREGSGDNEIYGEVTFRWIFYAVVDEEYVPPKTGVFSGRSWIEAAVLVFVGLLLLFMLLLIFRKKKRAEKPKVS